MLAQQCDLEPGEFIWTGGDTHIYSNHMEQVRLQLTREPLPLPRLELKRRPPAIDAYRSEDFEIIGYDAHPHIAGEVAVRSEERRVGKECVGTGRSPWSPDH